MQRRSFVVLVLLALGLIAGLFVAGVFDPAAPDATESARESGDTGGPMRVEGEDALHAGGQLVGREHGVGDAEIARGPVTVTVTNAGGHPLEGVPVVMGPAADLLTYVKDCTSKIADAEGRVTFADVPYDRSRAVGLIATSVSEKDFEDHGVVHEEGMRLDKLDPRVQTSVRTVAMAHIEGPELDLRSPVGVRYECRAFDATSGRRLRHVVYRPRSRFLDHMGRAADAPLAAVGQTPRDGLALTRFAPKGHLTWYPWLGGQGISPSARRVVIHDALMPDVTVTVSFEGEGGAPDLGDKAPYVQVGRRGFGASPGRPDAVGRVPLPHIPFIAHAQVNVWWQLAGTLEAAGSGRFGARPDEPLHITLRLSHGGEVEDVSEDIEIENDLDHHESFERERRVALASATVRVVRPDGSPGVGAHVWIGGRRAVADHEGVATIPKVLPGKASVHVWGAGLVEPRAQELEPGSDTRLTLRGDVGGRVRVRVLAPDGSPLPFAQVFLNVPGDYVDVHNGVQRIDDFTDRDGVRTFHQVPPGRRRVRVQYAEFDGALLLDVIDGKTVAADVTIPLKKK